MCVVASFCRHRAAGRPFPPRGRHRLHVRVRTRGEAPLPDSIDPQVYYAAPVDRTRLFRRPSAAAEAAGANATRGSIALAQMPMSPAGGMRKAVWPLFWVLTAPQNEQGRCMEIIASWGRQALLLPRASLAAQHGACVSAMTVSLSRPQP